MRGPDLLHRYQEHKEAVRNVFDREGVIAAYLFGSGATGNVDALSDLDFGVYLEEDADGTYMDILTDLIGILGDDIDLVHMNNAELLLNADIINGTLLYERDHDERVRLEATIMQKNMDVKYYRDRYIEANLERIAKKGLA